jgi:predicted ABC-type transport system involved in lysophospholipase L1 biosynthesis ATPase subunit
MDIVSTKKLCKVYGHGETAVQALRDVNIRVQKGEFVAVTGLVRKRKIHIAPYARRGGYSNIRRSAD